MKKDLNIDSKHLRNDEHFQYNIEFHDLVEDYGPDNLKVEPQFEVFNERLADEDDAFKRINRSPITDAINVVDARRNELFRGMVITCKAAAVNLNSEVKQAGKEILVVLNTYGNLAKKPRNEKNSAFFNLLDELSKNHGEAVETAGIGKWLDEIQSCNDECHRLMKARNDETTAARPNLSMEEARAAVDSIHNEIVEHIRARRLLGEGELFANFLRRLDVLVGVYNTGVARRSGRVGKDGDGSLPLN